MAEWFYSKQGQQLGPISDAALRQMAAGGELLPEDMVWKEGMAQWAKASQLKGLFAAAASAPSAPMQTPHVPPPSPAVEYSSLMPGNMQPAGGTSGMSIASLVCGILFCIPFSSLLAIIFGIIGINQTGAGRRSGRGLAIAGLVLGCLGILVNIASIGILLPALHKAREAAQQIKSAANEKQIGLAIMMYANANNGQYPPGVITLAKAESLEPSVFVNPSSNDTPAPTLDALESGGHDSYIYVGAGLVNPAADTVVLYEKPTSNTTAAGANVLYADGRVEFVTKARLPAVLGPGKN